MKLIKHFFTITKHRFIVRKYCFKVGLIKQGFMHDVSKYSPTEFFRGVKYYRGVGSPISKERLEKGYSIAWLHHKGRNKHHAEYWIDLNKQKNIYEPIEMPIKYVVECFIDHIAASKVYNKKNYKKEMVREYFLKEIKYVPYHPHTQQQLLDLINFYIEHSDKTTFRHIKKEILRKKRG